jgi:hypothetical protein
VLPARNQDAGSGTSSDCAFAPTVEPLCKRAQYVHALGGRPVPPSTCRRTHHAVRARKAAKWPSSSRGRTSLTSRPIWNNTMSSPIPRAGSLRSSSNSRTFSTCCSKAKSSRSRSRSSSLNSGKPSMTLLRSATSRIRRSRGRDPRQLRWPDRCCNNSRMVFARSQPVVASPQPCACKVDLPVGGKGFASPATDRQANGPGSRTCTPTTARSRDAACGLAGPALPASTQVPTSFPIPMQNASTPSPAHTESVPNPIAQNRRTLPTVLST